MSLRRRHRMAFGAEVLADHGVAFRLWAPRARTVELCREGDAAPAPLPMETTGDGWFEIVDDTATHGTLYRFRIDAEHYVPDPASRAQPCDVHGPSCVIDPERFAWREPAWQGRPWEQAVLYELHVGTFSAAGTFAGAAERLGHLAELGITAVELMPVGEFPGKHNWGYDGVLPFAPDRCYGLPDDLKAFIEAAHQTGIMVIIDVVYNHFGPEGNYLHRYAEDFFTDRHATPWGAAIDFSGTDSEPVRRFFIDNALYWLEEFDADGLRLDAVHAIFDESEPDILLELAHAVRRRMPAGRHVHLLLENDDNAARYLRCGPRSEVSCYTAQWNDDWHHAWHVLLTGGTHGYYADYAGHPHAHLLRCLIEGFAYQGESSPYRDMAHRGEPSADLPSTAFIAYLQNHDQVGNRAYGERLTTLVPQEPLRAAVAIQLLSPSIPALFMGEEFGCERPFLFFTDFAADLQDSVREGRRRELVHLGWPRAKALTGPLPDPTDEATFARSVLDWKDALRPSGREWQGFYRALLELRCRAIVPRLRGARGAREDSALLGPSGLVACWCMGDGSPLRLVANLGPSPLRLDRELEVTGAAIYRHPESGSSVREGATLPPWFVEFSLGSAQ